MKAKEGHRKVKSIFSDASLQSSLSISRSAHLSRCCEIRAFSTNKFKSCHEECNVGWPNGTCSTPIWTPSSLISSGVRLERMIGSQLDVLDFLHRSILTFTSIYLPTFTFLDMTLNLSHGLTRWSDTVLTMKRTLWYWSLNKKRKSPIFYW